MMSSKVNIYVARNLTELNAKANQQVTNADKIHLLAKSVDRVFLEGEKFYLDGDEEKAYIFYMRYFNLISIIKASSEYKKDSKYYDAIIGKKNFVTALEKAEKLGGSLKARYDELEAVKISQKLNGLNLSEKSEKAASTASLQELDVAAVDKEKEEKTGQEPASIATTPKIIDPVAPPGGITVQTVYRLMKDSNVSVLLMDARSSGDFKCSHIKGIDCINVPADCLQPGITVNKIEQGVPVEYRSQWRTRNAVDYIVIFEWRGSAKALDPRSCSAILKDALTKWDPETVLQNEPLIMEGGYEEWLLCYPAQTTNSNVKPPPVAGNVTAIPSLDKIDYDVDLDFMAEPLPVIDTVKPPTESNGSLATPTSELKPPSGSAIVDSHVRPTDTLSNGGRNIAHQPTVDRSTKPSSAALNNTFETTNVQGKSGSQSSNFNRISNQLNEENVGNSRALGDTANSKYATPSGSNVAKPAVPAVTNSSATSAAKVPPHLDRSTKPPDKASKKIMNHDVDKRNMNAEADRLEKEFQQLNEKKTAEAHALADLMRKKKKLEAELASLAQRHQALSEREIQNKQDSSAYDASSSDEDATGSIVSCGGSNRSAVVARNVNIDRYESEKPRDLELSSRLRQLEEQNRKLEEMFKRLEEVEVGKREADQQKLIEEERKRQQVIDAEERVRAEQERKRLEAEAAEKIKREIELKEQQRRIAAAEEKKKEQLAAEQKRKEVEETEQKRLADLAEQQQQRLKEEKEKKARKDEEARSMENQSKQQLNDGGDRRQQLPVNWERRFDQTTQRYYYINHQTKTTQWVPPVSGSSSYKMPLKGDDVTRPTAATSGGGLTRSHSSPNIAKMLQDAESEETSSAAAAAAAAAVAAANTVRQPVPNRNSKPQQSAQKLMVQTEVSSAKVRNLQPTWGTVHRGLTGLRNLGNTCYMNSTIQCLSNTVPLTLYFLTNNFVQDINRDNADGYGGQVADEYAVLIKALWSGQYKSVAPRDFRSVCCLMNSMFASSQHQDSQELLMYLMSALSEGLNKVKRKPSLPAIETDDLDDEVASEKVWNHFRLEEDSIFVDLFKGQYKSIVMCQICNKKSVKFDSFMYLTLPIPSSTRCNLSECLIDFCKESKLTGDSRWFCPRCRCKQDAVQRLVIWRLPPILLIVLKRFHYDGIWRNKITTYVDFPVEGLEMARYISGPKVRPAYNLFAVSNHYGMLDGGHYTATCRSPVNSRWYKYDDHEVSEVYQSDIKSSAAYMLFYTSMKMDQFRM